MRSYRAIRHKAASLSDFLIFGKVADVSGAVKKTKKGDMCKGLAHVFLKKRPLHEIVWYQQYDTVGAPFRAKKPSSLPSRV